MLTKKNIYTLPNKYWYFSINNSKFYFLTISGLKIIKFPSIFFFKKDQNNLSFLSNFNFINFVQFLRNGLTDFYFVKLRIRGLGYRWRTISENFHYIFFNYTNYYYFFNPSNIIIKIYKKRMLILSYIWQAVRSIMSHILLLQKIGPYALHGIRWAKQIIILKKSRKKI